MKIFLDTGDVDAIRIANATGLVDGVTTNPSHIAKTGRPFKEVVKEICDIVSGPISAEVMAEDAAGMVAEAVEIAGIAPNVAVRLSVRRSDTCSTRNSSFSTRTAPTSEARLSVKF